MSFAPPLPADKKFVALGAPMGTAGGGSRLATGTFTSSPRPASLALVQAGTISPELHRAVAKRIAKFTSRIFGIDVEEVRGAGWEAAARALMTYDPAKTRRSVETYVCSRVWWAMQDACRRLGPVSRYDFRERKGLTTPYDRKTSAPRPLVPVSLDVPAAEGSELTLLDLDPQPDFADDLCQHLDVGRAIARLIPRRRFACLAYMRGYTQAEIGTMLHVSEGRVNQILKECQREFRKIAA